MIIHGYGKESIFDNFDLAYKRALTYIKFLKNKKAN